MIGQDSDIRLRLDLSYDGTGFSGWAAQPNRRTVAGCLSAALTLLFRQDVPLVVAGRTDAGVHASGQVAHIDVERGALALLAPRRRAEPPRAGDGFGVTTGICEPAEPEPAGPEPAGPEPAGPERAVPEPADLAQGCTGLLRRLAGLLPPDVRVHRVTPAPAGFDARFSALRRHYRYLISTAEWGVDPLRRTDVFGRRRPLDVDAMSRAAVALLGLHDFAAFCKPRAGATTIRELQALTVRRSAELVVVDVQADAFCHSMVRSLVGALMAVGDGQPVSRPAQLLAGASRTAGAPVAPALGLTLVAVDYPPDAELAARAAITRTVRGQPPG